MDFFSDRELGNKPATREDIDINVWNGIVAIIDSFIADNSFSKDFPEHCQDGSGVCGCNTILFYDQLKAYIPTIEIPIRRKDASVKERIPWESDEKIEKSDVNLYSTLDMIEFCHMHLYDAEPIGKFHEFFNHYHFTFNSKGSAQIKFRYLINSLFERNGIAFELHFTGRIRRVIPSELQKLFKSNYSSKDEILNQLMAEAAQYIILPQKSDRTRGIEKLWDAFERAKTFYSTNKKISAPQLINLVSNGNSLFESYLLAETFTLTDIGNKFQIRHFETDKQPITDLSHLDYLFFRMFSLIDLFIKELEKET